MHGKTQIIFEGLVNDLNNKEEKFDFKSKISSLHDKLNMEDSIKSFGVKLNLDMNSFNSLRELPHGFKEAFKNFFGVYTKHDYDEVKDLFLKIYKYRCSNVREFLDKPETFNNIIRYYIDELNLSPKEAGKAKKEILEKYYNMNMLHFIYVVALKFIKHCKEPKKMDALLMTYYKMHYINMIVSIKKITTILGADIKD